MQILNRFNKKNSSDELQKSNTSLNNPNIVLNNAHLHQLPANNPKRDPSGRN